MPPASPIGDLFVRLKLERDRFRSRLVQTGRDIDKVGGRVKSFSRDLGRFRAALIGVAGAAGIGLLARRAVAFGASIADVSERLGVGVEELQEWRFAANSAGIATEKFDIAVQRFTRRLAEARQGTGEALDALKEIGGVLGEDLIASNKGAFESLEDVADAFKALPDPADRVRLAFKLFDSEGVVFLQIMGDGAAAIQAMRQEARDLGVVLSADTVKQLQRARIEGEKFSKLIDANLARSFVALAPAIFTASEALAGFIANLQSLPAQSDVRVSLRVGEALTDVEDLRGNIAEIDDELEGLREGRNRFQFANDERAQELLRARFLATRDLAEAEERLAQARGELQRRGLFQGPRRSDADRAGSELGLDQEALTRRESQAKARVIQLQEQGLKLESERLRIIGRSAEARELEARARQLQNDRELVQLNVLTEGTNQRAAAAAALEEVQAGRESLANRKTQLELDAEAASIATNMEAVRAKSLSLDVASLQARNRLVEALELEFDERRRLILQQTTDGATIMRQLEELALERERSIELIREEQAAAEIADARRIEGFRRMDDAAMTFADTVGDAFEQLVRDGEIQFEQLARSFAATLLRMEADLLASDLLKILRSGIGGPSVGDQGGLQGILGSILGGSILGGGGAAAASPELNAAIAAANAVGPFPAFASGRLVTRPTVATIGDQGAEGVFPLTPTSLARLGLSGGGGGDVEINLVNTTGQQSDADVQRGSDGRRIVNLLVGEISRDIRSGGQVSQAIQQTFNGMTKRGVLR